MLNLLSFLSSFAQKSTDRSFNFTSLHDPTHFFPLFHERSIEHARDVHIKFIVASYSTVSDVVLDDSCVDRTGNVSLFDYRER